MSFSGWSEKSLRYLLPRLLAWACLLVEGFHLRKIQGCPRSFPGITLDGRRQPCAGTPPNPVCWLVGKGLEHPVLVRRCLRNLLRRFPFFDNQITFEAEDMHQGDLRHLRTQANPAVNDDKISILEGPHSFENFIWKLHATFFHADQEGFPVTFEERVVMHKLRVNVRAVSLANLA